MQWPRLLCCSSLRVSPGGNAWLLPLGGASPNGMMSSHQPCSDAQWPINSRWLLISGPLLGSNIKLFSIPVPKSCSHQEGHWFMVFPCLLLMNPSIPCTEQQLPFKISPIAPSFPNLPMRHRKRHSCEIFPGHTQIVVSCWTAENNLSAIVTRKTQNCFSEKIRAGSKWSRQERKKIIIKTVSMFSKIKLKSCSSSTH